MSKPKRDTDSKQSIQTLFLQPCESYELREVARLTDTPVRTLRREVARGGQDATKIRGVWRFTWRQAVFVALQRWTLAEIHEALGDAAAGVLPPLLSLRAVTVRLPAFIVCALETIARDGRTTLDAALHGELIDFAGTMAEQMEGIAPGYREAYLFPCPP
jgi:predicted transcriptional regulator